MIQYRSEWVVTLSHGAEYLVTDDGETVTTPRQGHVQPLFLAEEAQLALRVGPGHRIDGNVGLPALERINCVALDVEVFPALLLRRDREPEFRPLRGITG